MAGGANGELELLDMWASPFVLRVRLALSLKGVSCEYVEEDLRSKSELLLKSNPVYTKVPVLIHNCKTIYESHVILRYIDEAFAGTAPSVLPDDGHDRATAYFWASYIDGTLLKATSGKTEEEKAEWEKLGLGPATVETLEEALRECSKGKPFFGGDNPGYVDVVLGGLLSWVRAGDAMKGVKTFDPTRTPLLEAWAGSFEALDRVKAVMPDAGKLVEFAMAMIPRAAATSAEQTES